MSIDLRKIIKRAMKTYLGEEFPGRRNGQHIKATAP